MKKSSIHLLLFLFSILKICALKQVERGIHIHAARRTTKFGKQPETPHRGCFLRASAFALRVSFSVF